MIKHFVLILIFAFSIFAQGIPRAADGKPDFSGVWQPASTTPGSWESANAGTGLGGTGRDPNAPVALGSADRKGEGAPYKPEAARKVLESYNNRALDDPTARCLPPGIPRLHSFGLFPLQIVQTPKQIIMLYEYMSQFRIIPINAKQEEDPEPTYLGHPVGRWDGDTLVVDSIGFNDRTWLIGAGTLHSEKYHVVERFTRVNKDRVDYEATMTDPEVLTKPWVFKNSMMLREGTVIREYPCNEDNVDLQRYEKLIKEGVPVKRQ